MDEEGIGLICDFKGISLSNELYLRSMIILDSHTVLDIDERIRFEDYVIGLFQSLETRSSVKKAIKKKRFLLNGEVAETGNWMAQGDRIDLLEKMERPKAYDKDIEIVYEDDFLVIVNKPAGLIVSGNQFKTLENCLVDQVRDSSAPDALGWALPIHRLDAPTSGLVIFAKTMNARRKLGEMLESKTISKKYHAVVHGIPEISEIDAPIDLKASKSVLAVIRTVASLQNGFLTLVQLEPITGRTHQLRIHCAGIGHSIVGDKQYENEWGTFRNKGLMLAATNVSLQHPITEEELSVSIPIPNKFTSLLEREEIRAARYVRD